MPEVPYTYKGITDEELEIEDKMRDQAGAGRGRQGGPTAKELADYERKQNEGIFTAGMKVPQDIDNASAPVKKKVVKKADGGMTGKYMSFTKSGKPDGMKSVKKMASGGMTASRRADGIAERGKTRGKMC